MWKYKALYVMSLINPHTIRGRPTIKVAERFRYGWFHEFCRLKALITLKEVITWEKYSTVVKVRWENIIAGNPVLWWIALRFSEYCRNCWNYGQIDSLCCMHLIARFSQLLRCEVALLNKYLRYQLLLDVFIRVPLYLTVTYSTCSTACP